LLVVEDDLATRTALAGIFSRMGWFVRLAETQREGLAWLDANEPCCLVLDLELPDGRGEAVLEKLRAKGLRTHVAVCTGSMDRNRLDALTRLEPDALLTKPVKLEDIWRALCRVEAYERAEG
jgi:DNA-binding NtrC family response regulator